jgi:hypothetical protein
VANDALKLRRIHDCCYGFQGEILVGCRSRPRSEERGLALIFVSHVSAVQVCVSPWACLSHHLRNGQGITRDRKHFPGVIDQFRLRDPAYRISHMIIHSLFDHPSSPHSTAHGYIGTRIQQNSERRIYRIEWETPPDRGGFEGACHSSKQVS